MSIEGEQMELPLFDSDESALGKAIRLWQSGQLIPLDVFYELQEQGYDVPALESRYYNVN